MTSNRVPRSTISRLMAVTLLTGAVSTATFVSAQSFAPDHLMNFKVPGCTCPGGIPPNQYAPSVAAWGRFVLASWYDLRYRCLGSGTHPAQSYGYSTDHGATFKDAGLMYRPGGLAFFGNPSVAVNAKTGDFYIVGYGRPPSGFPIFALKGHFEADSFKIDTYATVATPDPGNFYERAWVAVDSVSGSVHVIWNNYEQDATTAIEYQKLDANLNPVGPELVLQVAPYGGPSAQNPQVAVGPGGEVYAAWSRYSDHFYGVPSSLEVVRSVDFGASFGPVQVMHTLQANTVNDPPGSLRVYGLSDVSIAVDRTNGPHRGRLYMAWDEPAHFQDAPFGTHTAAIEVEDSTFVHATPFVVGGKIRGVTVANPTGDKDYFKFSGLAGQTLVMRPDSIQGGGSMRIICESTSDTSSLGTYRTLALSAGQGIVTGLPYDGDYYLQIAAQAGGALGPYVYQTAFDTPTAGDIGRDQRDQLIAYSDDGMSWSTPVRINDSAPGIDGCFPSVAVDDRGHVHCSWIDFRTDGCGDLSDMYIASSGDGGVSWGANRRLSDASSYWNALKSCSIYNRGTYQQLTTAGDYVYAVFPDTRLGDTDVFMDASRLAWDSSCPPATNASANQETALVFGLSNQGSFATPLAWSLSDDAGWLTGATPALSGSQNLAADGGTVAVTATLALPLECEGDSTIVRFVTHDPHVPGDYDTCVTVVRCVGTTSVPIERQVLSFSLPSPSPSRGATRLRYTLTRSGPVRLALFDVAGARIRVLESGIRAAGPHEIVWDGRDQSGREVAAGAFFARLDAEHRSIQRSLIVVR